MFARGGGRRHYLDSLKPIQVSKVDYDEYLKARAKFTTDEWIDTLVQSLGFNPGDAHLPGQAAPTVALVPPFRERNYNEAWNQAEVARASPTAVAKFSPHGMSISRSKSNALGNFSGRRYRLGKIGSGGVLTVCFDEFAGKAWDEGR